MTHSVVFSPEAQDDLLWLYDAIAEHSGTARALAYTERIAARCVSLANFPERGTTRDDLRPGLRIFYAGRDLQAAFDDESG